MICLGIDGGGTKTDYLLFDTDRGVIGRKRAGSIDVHLIGLESFKREIGACAGQLLQFAGLQKSDLSEIAIGVPCYGENRKESAAVDHAVREVFSAHCRVENDVTFSTVGALSGESGICMLAGTGSMAMGIAEDGTCVRSGGWSRYYSDEGSAFWLGTEGMRLFVKQADGILPRGALYELVMEEYHLDQPMDFIRIGDSLYEGRSGAAGFQLLLKRAADTGDETVLTLYSRAAEEMAAQVLNVRRKLFDMGYSHDRVVTAGGLLNNNHDLRALLGDELAHYGMTISQGHLSPAAGSILAVLTERDGGNREKYVQMLKRGEE